MDDSFKSYQGNLQQNQSILQNNLGKTYFQDSSLGQELFESIAASSIDGIFVFDKDFCCLYANPAAAGYIPNTIKTAAGWTLFDLLSDSAPYIRSWIDEIERVFQTSKQRYSVPLLDWTGNKS